MADRAPCHAKFAMIASAAASAASVFTRHARRVPPANLNTLLQVFSAALGLGGQFLVNQQNPAGFALWLGSNAALMWLQLRMRLYILATLSVAYFGLCVQGLLNWRQ